MKGKVALITGAGTGIGRAIALRLAKEGINIIINYSKSEKEAIETKMEIENLGVTCEVFQASVANDQDIRKMIDKIIDKFNRLDILVNNAGTTDFVDHDDLEGLKEEYWDRVMDVNVKGLFSCCRACAPHLKKQKGCIINITSVAGQTGLGSSIAYAESKAATNSITKSLARVLSPEVRVNSVAPGVVMTRWHNSEENIKHLISGTPLGRVATPEDVADITYSLIAHANFVTGEIIRVDGGKFI